MLYPYQLDRTLAISSWDQVRPSGRSSDTSVEILKSNNFNVYNNVWSDSAPVHLTSSVWLKFLHTAQREGGVTCRVSSTAPHTHRDTPATRLVCVGEWPVVSALPCDTVGPGPGHVTTQLSRSQMVKSTDTGHRLWWTGPGSEHWTWHERLGDFSAHDNTQQNYVEEFVGEYVEESDKHS